MTDERYSLFYPDWGDKNWIFQWISYVESTHAENVEQSQLSMCVCVCVNIEKKKDDNHSFMDDSGGAWWFKCFAMILMILFAMVYPHIVYIYI